MLIGGWFMLKHPPKQINGVIGYRTRMSRKNKETWAFAHETCGRIWMRVGAILLVLSTLVQFLFFHGSDRAIGNMTLVLEGVQLFVLLLTLAPVEAALQKNFDENGNRKEQANGKTDRS